MIDLYFKPTNENTKKPIQAHENDAGWDLYSTEEAILYPNKPLKLSTGVAVQAKFIDPEDAKKWKIEAKVEGTSGNAAKLGIFPIGGVVDQDYTGEVGVVLVNGAVDPINIKPHSKIAQLVIHAIPKIRKVNYLSIKDNFEATDRGDAGFGSTGTAVSK